MVRSVHLITADSRLARLVARVARPARLTIHGRLKDIRSVGTASSLVIDPRAIDVSALARIVAWRSRPPEDQTILLALQADPDVLLQLARVVPGTVAKVTELGALLGNGPRHDTRSAWSARQSLLSPLERPPLAQRFLSLCRLPAGRGLTVAGAARALHLSPRQLSRNSHRWFGCAPLVMIGLCRVVNLADDLRQSDLSLERLAGLHDFPDQSSMSRLFLKYVGTRPGAFRRRPDTPRLTENDMPVSVPVIDAGPRFAGH